MKIISVLIGILILIEILLAFQIIIKIQNRQDYFGSQAKVEYHSEVSETGNITQLIKDCSRKSVIEASECARKHISSFYYYNISNVGREMSFDEIRAMGAVCSQYAQLYCSMGEKIGFHTELVSIKTSEDSNSSGFIQYMHQFCIWSSEEAYVILDQDKKEVFVFGDENS
jgi:hypothetical protein